MGIKIKDDFDLDKLIGFDKCEDGTYSFMDKENGAELIIGQNRFIFVSTDDWGGVKSFEIPFMLYNLFKMGIIEEVRDE